MDRAIFSVTGIALPEVFSFSVRSLLLLTLVGGILYLMLGATYLPIHDALHDFRHFLAIVPCH